MKNLKILLIALLAVFALDLAAQWTNDPQLNTMICDTTGEQVYPQIALNDQNGTGFISWYSNEGGNQYDVYLNSINKDGILKWGKEGLLVSDYQTDTWVSFYGMLVDDEDCALLVNRDMRNGNSNVYAYRISPTGEFLWGDDGLQITSSPYAKSCISAIQDNNGDYLIGWDVDSVYTDTVGEIEQHWFVEFQKYGKDMTAVWDYPKTIKCDTVKYSKQDFDFILKPDNGFYMIFTGLTISSDTTLGLGNKNIYAQSFNSDGEPLWEDPVALSSITMPDNMYMYENAFLHKDGGLIVIWRSGAVSTVYPVIRMQRLGLNGERHCTDGGTMMSSSVGYMFSEFWSNYDPVLDRTFVFWSQRKIENLQEYCSLNGQLLTSDGDRLWGDEGLEIIPFTVDTLYTVRKVAGHPDGSVITVYTNDYAEYIDTTAISVNITKAFKVDAEGNYLWNPEHIIVSETHTEKTSFELSQYNNGQWVVVWEENRENPAAHLDNAGIYAQNIKEDGSLGPLSIPYPGAEQHFSIQTWAASKTIYILNPENSRGEIIVLNMLGQQVAQAKLTGDTKQQIRLTVPSGCYLVSVVSEEEVVTRKVVVE